MELGTELNFHNGVSNQCDEVNKKYMSESELGKLMNSQFFSKFQYYAPHLFARIILNVKKAK